MYISHSQNILYNQLAFHEHGISLECSYMTIACVNVLDIHPCKGSLLHEMSHKNMILCPNDNMFFNVHYFPKLHCRWLFRNQWWYSFLLSIVNQIQTFNSIKMTWIRGFLLCANACDLWIMHTFTNINSWKTKANATILFFCHQIQIFHFNSFTQILW